MQTSAFEERQDYRTTDRTESRDSWLEECEEAITGAESRKKAWSIYCALVKDPSSAIQGEITAEEWALYNPR
jgi:hypothetical protein